MHYEVKVTGDRSVVARIFEDDEDLAYLQLSFPTSRRPYAFLHSFYVYPRLNKKPDSAKYKGMGKRLLCFVIARMIDENRLRPDTSIELEASGGTLPENFVSSESERSLDSFLSAYPIAVTDMQHDVEQVQKRTVTRADKANLAERIRQNHRLIAYYETYGFKVVKDDGEAARMSGTIAGILDECHTRQSRSRGTH